MDAMNKFSPIWLAAVVFPIGCATWWANPQEGGKQALRLVQTISLPNVKGRLDHIDVDVKGKRLFVAGLENGTLEVADLRAGKWMRSIPGFNLVPLRFRGREPLAAPRRFQTHRADRAA